MGKRIAALGLGGASALGFAAYLQAAPAQAPAAPKARYAMDVGTTTGLAAMGGGMGGAMAMAFGGGGNREARDLHLRLGSILLPTGGAPKADHFFLPPAKLGKSVPLLSPEHLATPDQEARSQVPSQFQRPKGRMLLFWGCGEHAPKGQPVVIDFGKIAQGQMPPNLFTSRVPVDHGPSAANSKTYGEWPNRASSKQPQSGSLLGAHRIAGNYAPEIAFILAQDYMPGLHVQNSPLASGAIGLSWNGVTGATGFYAWTFGATMNGSNTQDLVWWSSSAAREFGGGLWDWLPPETVRRLVNERVVLPPTQTQCAIPAEVKAASPSFMMGNMVAYGPQADFAFPPRPASPATPWRPDWTARVRFRSNSSFLIGGPAGMGAAMGGDGENPSAPPKKCRGGLLGAALGAC